MSTDTPHRGGAPVGFVTELSPVEAGAVVSLRLWCEGPEGQRKMQRDFSTALGPSQADAALRSLALLCEFCARHGRRPMMRHRVGCKCLGGDEACFANFIGYASDGEREEALMIAMTLVRPTMASPLVGLAEEFGFALKRMALMPDHHHTAQPRATYH